MQGISSYGVVARGSEPWAVRSGLRAAGAVLGACCGVWDVSRGWRALGPP
jgi:hypothetical protein